MALAVHPEAARAADHQGKALAAELRGGALAPSEPWPYQPPVPIAAALTDGDVVGAFTELHTDRAGREIARSRADRDAAYALEGEGHARFLKLARALHGQRAIRDAVSEKTVRDLVFEWLCTAGRDTSGPALTAAVLAQCEALVADRVVLVPIFGLHVEEPVRIGHVVFADVTPDELAAWRERASRAGDVPAEYADAAHARVVRLTAGKAAARFAVRAEHGRAVERAVAETELSLAVLRLCSIGAFAPERPTTYAPIGREAISKDVLLVMKGDGAPGLTEGIVFADDARPEVLDAAWIRERVLPFVAPWSALLTRAERSAFETDALRSMLLYARATTYRDVSEKLIHMFVAVEGLLLRNDTEPVSAALADRLAFVAERSPDERIAVTKRLRAVYGMRSRFVHHAVRTGPDPDDLRLLEAFFVDVSQCFAAVGAALQDYPTREAFIDALDRRKFS